MERAPKVSNVDLKFISSKKKANHYLYWKYPPPLEPVP